MAIDSASIMKAKLEFFILLKYINIRFVIFFKGQSLSLGWKGSTPPFLRCLNGLSSLPDSYTTCYFHLALQRYLASSFLNLPDPCLLIKLTLGFFFHLSLTSLEQITFFLSFPFPCPFSFSFLPSTLLFYLPSFCLVPAPPILVSLTSEP